ncbi:MAG: trypsin-like peptidase domain-containing protein [Planctomycetaceae bacterium]|nr:trypsin-like peptidase domain-containing protein [Planctomycetaceae bacterium]
MTHLTTLLVVAAFAGTGEANDAVLVQFSSQSCTPCRAMQPTVSRLISDGYPVQRIDADKHPETARQYGVRGLPTFVLLVGNREAGRIEGPASYDRLAAMFQGAQPQQAVPAMHEEPVSQPAPAQTAGPAQTARPAPRALQATEFRGGSPEQAALAASVRLRVEDSSGYGFGTGTIIDTHDDEALVVTCGHLFRESQGKGKIGVELFAAGASQPVEGHLIGYDLDRDIALVSIRPGIAVQAVAIAPPGFTVRKADRAFTVGCDKGADATVRQTEITAVNRFLGKPNLSAAGAPIDGRSGGGLFTADGQLIGVCNAADHASNEGLYAGLASIHWQLDQIGQSEIYQRRAATSAVAAVPGANSQPASLPELPSEMPSRTASGGLPVTPVGFSNANTGRDASLESPAAFAAVADADKELVVIVRSKRNPDQRSEIYLVDQASPDLLSGIVSAARQGAAQRAAQVAAREQAPAAGARQLYQPPPVVRAQSGE